MNVLNTALSSSHKSSGSSGGGAQQQSFIFTSDATLAFTVSFLNFTSFLYKYYVYMEGKCFSLLSLFLCIFPI